MNTQMHPTEALQDLVDGRLSGTDRDALETHLEDCAQCRREFAMLSGVKRIVTALPKIELPSGLAARIGATLNTTAPTPEPTPEPTTEPTTKPITAVHRADDVRRAWARWLAPLAIAAVILVAAFIWWRPAENLPQLAADAAADYPAGRLALTSTDSDADALNAFFARNVSFPVRVFDLRMMGFSLAGGRKHQFGARTSALWVYTGTAGSMVCQMYPGAVDDLPRPAETRVANGITFSIYHASNGTQVFWQEGDIVCVLASDLPAEDVIQLAIAKAMKP